MEDAEGTSRLCSVKAIFSLVSRDRTSSGLDLEDENAETSDLWSV